MNSNGTLDSPGGKFLFGSGLPKKNARNVGARHNTLHRGIMHESNSSETGYLQFNKPNRDGVPGLSNDTKRLDGQAYRLNRATSGVSFTPFIRYGDSKSKTSGLSHAGTIGVGRALLSSPLGLVCDHGGYDRLYTENTRLRCSVRGGHKTKDHMSPTVLLSSSLASPCSQRPTSSFWMHPLSSKHVLSQPSGPFDGIARVDVPSTRTSSHRVLLESQPKRVKKLCRVAKVSTPVTVGTPPQRGVYPFVPSDHSIRSKQVNVKTVTTYASERTRDMAGTDWTGLQLCIQSHTHRTNLTTLDLSGFRAMEHGQWRWLCLDVIPQLYALQTLRLAGMGLEDWHISELLRGCGVQTFQASLSHQTTPRRPDVAGKGTSMMPLQCGPLVRTILPCIRIVDVSHNSLSHYGAGYLGQLLLWTSDTLEELHVSSNPLRDKGIEILGLYLSRLCVESARAEPDLFPKQLVEQVHAASQVGTQLSPCERTFSYTTEEISSGLLHNNSSPRSILYPTDNKNAVHQRIKQRAPNVTSCLTAAIGPLDSHAEASSICSSALPLRTTNTAYGLDEVHIGPSLLNTRDCKASVQGLLVLLSGASRAHRLRVLLAGKNSLRFRSPLQEADNDFGAGKAQTASNLSSDVLPKVRFFPNFNDLKPSCALEQIEISDLPLSQVCSSACCRKLISNIFFACPRLGRLDVSSSFERALLPANALLSTASATSKERVLQNLQTDDDLKGWRRYLKETDETAPLLQHTCLAGQVSLGNTLAELFAHVAFTTSMRQQPLPLAFCHIRELRLSKTGLTDMGVRWMCIALRNLPESRDSFLQHLSILDVSGNFLTVMGCLQLIDTFLIESPLNLTILELQENAGLTASDASGLDAINTAVQKALARRAERKGPCRTTQATGSGLSVPTVIFPDSGRTGEDPIPLTIQYGPHGDSSAVYCGRYDARNGCRINYGRDRSKHAGTDDQGSLQKHDPPREKGGLTGQYSPPSTLFQIHRQEERVLDAHTRKSDFFATDDSSKECVKAPLGRKRAGFSSSRNKHPEDSERINQSRGADGFLTSKSVRTTMQVSFSPKPAMFSEDILSFMNLADSTGVRQSRTSCLSDPNDSSTVSQSPAKRVRSPLAEQQGDFEDRSACEERHHSIALLPLSNTEVRSSSILSFQNLPEVGAGNMSPEVLSPLVQQISETVTLPSPLVNPPGEHSDPYGGIGFEEVTSPHPVRENEASQHKLAFDLAEPSAGAMVSKAEHSNAGAFSSTAKVAGLLLPEVKGQERMAEMVDRVEIPLADYPQEGVAIRKKLFLTNSTSMEGMAKAGDNDPASGLCILTPNVKQDDSAIATKVEVKHTAVNALSFPHRSVMRSFIISYNHPPGHLLCRVMQVLQEQNADGEAARFAMEADILRFLQTSRADSNRSISMQLEKVDSYDLIHDTSGHRSRKKNSKKPIKEQVRCILEDLVKRGAIRFEVTTHRRRAVVLQHLHEQLSVPTLAEQEACFVELMTYLRARSASFSPRDTVLFVSSLVARSTHAAYMLDKLYNGSAIAAVHQNHQPSDRRRLLELLEETASEKSEQSIDSMLIRPSLPRTQDWSALKRRLGGDGWQVNSSVVATNEGHQAEDSPTQHHDDVHSQNMQLIKQEQWYSKSPNQPIHVYDNTKALHGNLTFERSKVMAGSRTVEDSMLDESPLVLPMVTLMSKSGSTSLSGSLQEDSHSIETDIPECPTYASGGRLGENVGVGALVKGERKDAQSIQEHSRSLGRYDTVSFDRHISPSEEAFLMRSPGAGEGGSVSHRRVPSDEWDSSSYSWKYVKPNSHQLVESVRKFVISYAHTEGGAVCRAWRVLHAGEAYPALLREQARSALSEDFFTLLQPPQEDGAHTVSSVNVLFNHDGGTTGMLSLLIKTNERRMTIATRLQGSVVKGSLACVGTGGSFLSATSGVDAIDLKVLESDRTYFPRLQLFLEKHLLCDTVALLDKFLSIASFQEIKRRLLQNYHRLVLLVHQHHGTLSVVLKGFGVESMGEVVEHVAQLPLTGSLGGRPSEVIPSPHDSSLNSSEEYTPGRATSLNAVPDQFNITNSLPSTTSADQKAVLNRVYSARSHHFSDPIAKLYDYRKGEQTHHAGQVTARKVCRDESEASDTQILGVHHGPRAQSLNEEDQEGALDAQASPTESCVLATTNGAIFCMRDDNNQAPLTQQVFLGDPRATSEPEYTLFTTTKLAEDPDASRGPATISLRTPKPLVTSSEKTGWDRLVESKHQRLMRVAYEGMMLGVIPLDPSRQQRVRVLRGRYHGQRILLAIEWEIFFVVYFERSQPLGRTKRILILVHPVTCGLICMVGDDDRASVSQTVDDTRSRSPESLLSKRLIVRIERSYTPDEVGVPESELMQQLSSNVHRFFQSSKSKKEFANVKEPGANSICSTSDDNDCRDVLTFLYHRSLVIEVDADRPGEVTAAAKVLRDSVRRATEALHKSMLVGNVWSGPMPDDSNKSNKTYSKPIVTMPRVP